MLRTRVGRVGALIAVLGIMVLAASLFSWANQSFHNQIYYTKDHRAWVLASASNRPSLATDEVWRISAGCLAPFYNNAIEQAASRLSAHNDTKAPVVARDSRKMSEREKADQIQRAIAIVAKQRGEPLDGDDVATLSAAVRNNDAFTDHRWFWVQFNLEQELRRWRARASAVESKEVLLSAVRRLANGDIRGLDIRSDILTASSRIVNAKSSEAKIDLASQWFLGVFDFAEEEFRSIKVSCVERIAIKEIVESTTYHTELGRWPAENFVSFCVGLALVIFGLLFRPISTWVNSGS